MVTNRSWVNIRTRVPAEVGEAIAKMSSPDYPPYRIVRDIVVAHVNGQHDNLRSTTVALLNQVVEAVGYESVDALVTDLAKAYMKAFRYYRGEIEEDEASPDVDILEMFSDCNNTIHEKNLSILNRR